MSQTEEVALASDTWEALMRAHVTMMRRFQEAGNWDRLSVREYDVLYTLAKAGCAMSQKALLNGVLLSQPAVSRLLERLEKQGLLERGPDPEDRRGILVTLTKAGRDLQRQVGRQHGQTVSAHLTKALSPAQMATLLKLTNRIVEANQND